MRERRTRQRPFKVIEGKSRSSPGGVTNKGKKPVYYLLLFLALFLLLQILAGWIWATTRENVIATALAEQGSVPVSLSVAGLVTFDEQVILAPRPGFVYYNVKEGERVPVGKGLARITEFPLEKEPITDQTEKGVSGYFHSFKEWFLDEKKDDYSHLFLINEEYIVLAPSSGWVSLKLDGLEKYGPNSNFLYLNKEDYEENMIAEGYLDSGEKVSRHLPFLRIINNYRWYYSVVLPPGYGEKIADETNVKLCFSFSPEVQVYGERVEAKEGDNGNVEITWCIDHHLDKLSSMRWAEAEILFDVLEGMTIPRGALLELNGEKGVYVIEEGLIKFREVAVLHETEEELLVENLDHYQRVVVEPSGVKEGQRFYW
jgi:putative membrane fusion protein